MLSIGRCSTYVYTHHVHIISKSVCHTYADAGHMDMPNLFTVLSFSAEIRLLIEPDLSS